MIIREVSIDAGEFEKENSLRFEEEGAVYEDALFFDLEHYVYKKPICIGVFGCCYYEKSNNTLCITQYMIENSKDAEDILFMAESYFNDMYINKNKRHIVTFSGNNDFTVINYLFKKVNVELKLDDMFNTIDLQKEYEKIRKIVIGLKALEKEFSIIRESELMSGSNLAKTFCKIVRDEQYFNRMPEIKKKNILLYNQQDVVSLFKIYVYWKSIMSNGEI